MKEEMQKRMDTENQYYRRTGSLFRADVRGVKYYKCKEGPNLFDILMYMSGKFDPIYACSMAYVLRIFIHRGAATDGSDIICIEQTFKDQRRREEIFGHGAFCPVCKEYRLKSAAGAGKEVTDKLKYANWPRTIYNVYDRRNPGDGAQVFETSAYLLQQYLDSISRRTVLPGEAAGIENYVPYMDDDEGRSIAFDRQGTDEKTKFIGVKFEDRRTPIPDEVLKATHALDDLIAWPTVASAYESFYGIPMDKNAAGVFVPSSGGAQTNADRAAKYDAGTTTAAEKDVPTTIAQPVAPAKSPEELEAEELEARLAALKKKKEQAAAPAQQPSGSAAAIAATSAASAAPVGGAATDGCPSGHVFGKDIDEKPECEKCPRWKDCAKENDRLERAAR